MLDVPEDFATSVTRASGHFISDGTTHDGKRRAVGVAMNSVVRERTCGVKADHAFHVVIIDLLCRLIKLENYVLLTERRDRARK